MNQPQDFSLPDQLKKAFEEDSNALSQFAMLSKEDQFAIVEGATQIQSEQEMQAYMNAIFGG